MASYEKRASGLWSVRFSELTADGSAKQKRLSGFKTKKEAQYAYEDFLAKKKNAPPELKELKEISAMDMTFSELTDKYLEFQKSRLKAASYYDLTKKITSKITPYFGAIPLKEISPVTILDWQATISEYSFRYRKHLFTYLAAIYNFGDKYYDIPNIMKKVDKPRNLEGKKEMLFWTPEEFKKFIGEVSRPEYKMLFKFLYISGTRKGEALALGWEDIDFNKCTVKISKSVAYKVGENGKSYRIDTPKNSASERTIYLPANILSELMTYRQWQKENTAKQTFVFGGDDPLPPTSIERNLAKSVKVANVKRIRIHDFRHSCASNLIHQGVTIVAVSHHLGHSSTKQTLDTYSHLLPDDTSMIINALSRIDI